jgi:23S rRNA (guanosine2251-2'-O)-methyltransferase
MSEQIVYGVHPVGALLKSTIRKTKKLYIAKEKSSTRLQQIIELAEQKNLPVEYSTLEKLDKSFPEFLHQGVVAITQPLPQYHENDLTFLLEKAKKPSLILMIDGVTDPHNLGACLRSADAAGVDFVIIPKDKNSGITPVVSKVACGAVENLPLILVTNLARTIDMLKKEGVWVYGAAGEADTSLYQLDFQVSTAIVMGAEGAGLRRLTREKCDGLFSIPMLGTVSSLNVSVATGIALFEATRARLKV